MSSMDPMRDVFWIRSETMRKNFASPSRLHQILNTVIIIDEADNTSNDVQLLLRAFIEEFLLVTADSFLPVTTK